MYLNVLDVNDNAPVFTNHSFSIEVSENVEIGHQIATVHAEDADFGRCILAAVVDLYSNIVRAGKPS